MLQFVRHTATGASQEHASAWPHSVAVLIIWHASVHHCHVGFQRHDGSDTHVLSLLRVTHASVHPCVNRFHAHQFRFRSS